MKTVSIKCDMCGEEIGDDFYGSYNGFRGKLHEHDSKYIIEVGCSRLDTESGKTDLCMACMKDIFNNEYTEWDRCRI